MMCPACRSENEKAYSILSNSLVCLEPGCGFELEMPAYEAIEILELDKQLVCA